MNLIATLFFVIGVAMLGLDAKLLFSSTILGVSTYDAFELSKVVLFFGGLFFLYLGFSFRRWSRPD